ncbi:MAG: UvrD-helicase domain-containing protein [Pirellulales bacterium]
MVNGDWRGLLDSGLGKKIAAGELTYFNAPIEPEAVEVYRSVIDHASSELTNQLIDRTWATRDLLERFDERYWRLKERSGQLTFDDVTFALARAAWTDFGDVASFRLDGRIQHLLLDEFQDTSWPQWRVLEPLVRECLVPDAGKSFFCVGDVKQAIYGWRGGHAGILQRLHQHLENVHEESLTRSYRSAPAVIDLVNLVFGNLTQNPALARWRRAAQDWTEGFRPHETVKHDAAGYCRLREAERADDDEKQRHATLRTVVDEVTAIHEAAPTAEIGVLLRANDDVSRVILDLRLRYGIEASEEAGATLTNSPAVALVMSALQLADHPGDTVVRTHLAHSPLAQLFGGLETGDEEAGRQSRRIRHALLQNGYGETIRRWAAQLAPACDARDARRLDQLIDVALAYEPIATLRPSDFVRHVELQRVVDPVAARVRVMNIHQSKGLEFDAVVMAASGESMNRAPRVVASAPNPFAPVNRVLRYANETVQALLPDDARETFAAHKNNDVREQLNVLYVAVTRAVRALHIVVPPSARPNDSCAWLLRHALASGGNGAESMKTTPEDDGFLREMGDAAWCRDFAADVAGASRARGSGAAAELADEIVFARSPRQEIRRHATPSGGAADESSDSAALDLTGRFNAVGRVARKRGSLYHRWMELVEWLDDAEPTDEALCISAAEFRFSRPELQRHIDAFRSLLEQPNIRQALCRSAYQGDALAGGWNGEVRTANGCSLWRELPFAQVAATGWTTGRFDRLVAVRQGDRTVAADVIDFKTDAIAPHDADAVAAAVESHRAQMTSYGRAACRLLDLPPSRVRLRLLLLSVDVAVDVTHVATGDNS